MVYCGKASQGCQNCRTRRIKCDKKRPDCSQCIRLGKKCPGYRDQLSLMFRDESNKVMQKAHAQWATSGSPTENGESSATPLPASPSTWSGSSTPSEQPSSATSVMRLGWATASIPSKVDPTLPQRGLQFYIDRYLMNHPDSPSTPSEVPAYYGNSEALENVMIAVGLAGLSNRLGNRDLNIESRARYVMALKQIGELLATGDVRVGTVAAPVRSIITLALFEVVQGKGSTLTAGSANTHIAGAIALLLSVLPVAHMPNGGARGVLQLMFSMFIPSQTTDTALPPAFFDCLKVCGHLLKGTKDICCIDLAFTIARLLQLLAINNNTVLVDGESAVDTLIHQLLVVDSNFDDIENRLMETYPFIENQAERYPPQALFRGKWHIYNEIWAARIWNHFRWARVLLTQLLIKYVDEFPKSSRRCISPAERSRCYQTTQRMALDILTSTPSHWHHPLLNDTDARKYEASGQGGAGAAGLPSHLWHLTIAACAPNVSPDHWDWSFDILQVVWREMGMRHAMALSEYMQEHRRKIEREGGLVKTRQASLTPPTPITMRIKAESRSPGSATYVDGERSICLSRCGE